MSKLGQSILDVYEEAVERQVAEDDSGLARATAKFISAFEAEFEAANFQFIEVRCDQKETAKVRSS